MGRTKREFMIVRKFSRETCRWRNEKVYLPDYMQKRKRKTKHKLKPEYRQTILERDNYQCVECGHKNGLHVHHITPMSMGGGDEESNLITLCGPCHAEKHKDSPVYMAMINNPTLYQ